METELNQQEIDQIRKATIARQQLIAATEFIYTAKYLKVAGGAPDYIRYERFPHTIRIFRETGFAMNPIDKVNRMRSGEIQCIGPQTVVANEGFEINPRKYYSEWDIDYRQFAQHLKEFSN
ncbi:hypothetical protein PPL_07257 [Heterostelium album PN500]|uniref:Uncharacterized protein n=1 Tax=Heterostelium pallidum (strain ATCC 26659 / Pp 5 / PN500) TaxID=670386 RepID=D3BEU2_HETP5|nr:hypothetical protein PPL_07257 [Heterostelium album PN500]EFA80423.1 hypothetical protein PPL_07257 [Heterostelium album PN500]|eukprot:XP_020432543.1 hypothetical protein PPL_07257 [Heterostelium album PN500]